MTPRLAFAITLACAVFPATAWAQAALSAQSRLYAELIPHFRALQHDLAVLRVKERRRIDAAGDVVVVEATARDMTRPGGTVEEQMRQHAFGIFVVDRATDRRRFTVDIFATERRLDYEVRIRDADADRLTIGRAGGTYGDLSDQITYFWDRGAGKVVERVAHGNFGVDAIVERDGMVWAVGSDGTRGAVIKLRPGETTPVDVAARPDEPPAQHGGMVAGAPFGLPDVEFWVAEEVVRRHALTIDGRRFFVWSTAVAPNAHGGPPGPGIFELDAGRRFHAMPAPTWDTFAKLRPGRVRDGYTRDQTQLETEIGPVQVEGPRIWFGTTFYDGEGTSGVGGVGSFDVETRRWHLVHPAAVADWSSSAILVESAAVWLGLVRNTEGRGPGGGVVRWDRKSGETKRIAIGPAISVIRRVAGRLYLGTADGLFIVDGAKTAHIRVAPRRGGGLAATSTVR